MKILILVVSLIASLESYGLTSIQCAGFVNVSQSQKITSNFESLQTRPDSYKANHAEKLHALAVQIFSLFGNHLRTSETQSYFEFTLGKIGSQATRERAIDLMRKAGIREDVWEDLNLNIDRQDPWASFPHLERLPMAFGTTVPKKFRALGLEFIHVPQIMFQVTLDMLPRNQVYGLNEIILKYEFYLSYMLKRLQGEDAADGTVVSTALRELYDFSQRTYQNGAETLAVVNEGFSPMIFGADGINVQRHSHYPFNHPRHEIVVRIEDRGPGIAASKTDSATFHGQKVALPEGPGTFRGELVEAFQAGFIIRLENGIDLMINTNWGAQPTMVALRPIFEE